MIRARAECTAPRRCRLVRMHRPAESCFQLAQAPLRYRCMWCIHRRVRTQSPQQDQLRTTKNNLTKLKHIGFGPPANGGVEVPRSQMPSIPSRQSSGSRTLIAISSSELSSTFAPVFSCALSHCWVRSSSSLSVSEARLTRSPRTVSTTACSTGHSTACVTSTPSMSA
jgi:hypothetical protein